jgi:membrane protein implicated in regulation of membrane protease activity
MRRIVLSAVILLVVVVAAFVVNSRIRGSSRNLRGSFHSSSDGKTYLAITDDNGGGCGRLIVDDREWPYKLGEKSEIAPGLHVIKCGSGDSGIEFQVPAQTVFHFDYWGP